MDNRKERRHFLKQVQKVNCYFMLLYILVIVVCIYLVLAVCIHMWRFDGVNYCMLDCLHELEKPYNFGMIFLPLTLFGIFSGRNMYTYPAFVLKYHHVSEIWKILWANIVGKSILFSVIFTAVACCLCGMSSHTVNNWKEEKSLFFQITKSVYQGSTFYVIISFFLFTVLKLCLASAVLVLVDSLKQDSILGVLFLGVLVIVEWVFEKCSVFFNLFAISQNYFKNKWSSALSLCIGTLFLIMIYQIGKKIWKEKEFYG